VTSWKRSLVSFQFALAGLRHLVQTQPNARIHILLATTAVALGIALRLSTTELALLALTIGMVFALEAVNTAVESMVDLLQPQHHRVAGLAKDLAASAVLIGALASVAVGVLLFLPRLLVLVA
jgi:diacylglycerol kinase (ATP)